MPLRQGAGPEIFSLVHVNFGLAPPPAFFFGSPWKEEPRCYPLHRLIDQHGGNGTVLGWLDSLTADCPRKREASVSDQPRAVSELAEGVVSGPWG
jgi:hypothetical protein